MGDVSEDQIRENSSFPDKPQTGSTQLKQQSESDTIVEAAENAVEYSRELEQLREQYTQPSTDAVDTQAETTAENEDKRVYTGLVEGLSKQDDSLRVTVSFTADATQKEVTYFLDWPTEPDDLEDGNEVDIFAEHTGTTDTLEDTVGAEVLITEGQDGNYQLTFPKRGLRPQIKYAVVKHSDALPFIKYDPQASSLTTPIPSVPSSVRQLGLPAFAVGCFLFGSYLTATVGTMVLSQQLFGAFIFPPAILGVMASQVATDLPDDTQNDLLDGMILGLVVGGGVSFLFSTFGNVGGQYAVLANGLQLTLGIFLALAGLGGIEEEF